jgi:peptidoglycan hydrolase-like protein with peptidoglycan-binding domain
MSFETLPFRASIDADLEEVRGRGSASSLGRGARTGGAFRTMGGGAPMGKAFGRRQVPGQKFGWGDQRRHRWPYGPRFGPVGGGVETAVEGAGGFAPGGSEQIRWVQFMLNSIMGANLPTDGIPSRAFRAALRAFQGQRGLPASGFVGPDTIDALRAGASPAGPAPGPETADAPEELFGELELTGNAAAADATLARVARARTIAAVLKSLAGQPPVPGLYRLHRLRDGSFYTGISMDLRRRIREHALCLGHMGEPQAGWRVTLCPMPGSDENTIRTVEEVINQHHKQLGSKLLNTNTELELMELETL